MAPERPKRASRPSARFGTTQSAGRPCDLDFMRAAHCRSGCAFHIPRRIIKVMPDLGTRTP
jgi:hypothetical protein